MIITKKATRLLQPMPASASGTVCSPRSKRATRKSRFRARFLFPLRRKAIRRTAPSRPRTRLLQKTRLRAFPRLFPQSFRRRKKRSFPFIFAKTATEKSGGFAAFHPRRLTERCSAHAKSCAARLRITEKGNCCYIYAR